jgi:hypothetical protein
MGAAAGAALLGFLLAGSAAAVELNIGDREDALQMSGFQLDTRQRIQIEARGFWESEAHDDGHWSARHFFRIGGDEARQRVFAWILDTQTRELVWELTARDARSDEEWSSLRGVSEELELDPGRYEVYLHFQLPWVADWEAAEMHVDREDLEALEELQEQMQSCFVRVVSAAGAELPGFEPTGDLPDALVRMNRMGDSQLEKIGIRLDSDAVLRIYALGEHPRSNRNAADFGWIVDLETGERVWDMSRRRGRRAGGADKNRVFDREIELPRGRYVLSFGTDDSHSYPTFNAAPPYDPLNWGITVLPGEGMSRASFSTFDPPERGTPMVDFSRARDDDFFEQAFRLRSEAALKIYALGEGVDDGWTFVDYGWIVEAGSGETVWEMDARNTYAAGGAEKNRVFDGTVRLPAGEYIAYYICDDSHAYRDWNAAAPFDPEAWGMQVFGADAVADDAMSLVDVDDLQRAQGVLARIERAGDDERRRARFELSSPADVEIYALGEGIDGHMYDYGYLRDLDRGETIWRMEFDETVHAGGASKNRMVRTNMRLAAGRYELVYESDGSHSFEGWNDRRPEDPLAWGISIRQAQ